MPQYDYLIIGSDIIGAVFAHKLSNEGKRCLVIEKRGYTADNTYDENQDGILVHRYRLHIFHASKKEIWKYINQFGAFNHFVNDPIANYRGELYNLPSNMNTFHRSQGTVTPGQVTQRLKGECMVCPYAPRSPEEQALSLIDSDTYEKLIKGYIKKQWGRACGKLLAFIIR